MMVNNPEQIAKRGAELYEANKAALEPIYNGSFVAFDLESGRYFIGKDPEGALNKLREEISDSIPYLSKIGPNRGIYTLRTVRGRGDNWKNFYGLSGS